jgi:hypothetical protein
MYKRPLRIGLVGIGHLPAAGGGEPYGGEFFLFLDVSLNFGFEDDPRDPIMRRS